MNRRDFLRISARAGAGIGAVGLRPKPVVADALLGEDGLHKQPWFVETFLEMADDHAEAKQAGKRFAVLWEQKGCPYCAELHRVNFADPGISKFVTDRFVLLQLNLWGSREVTDFDGTAVEERELGRRWRVNFTPTIQFFTDASIDGRAGVDLEIARMPGYFKPLHFLSMFEFVHEKAYERVGFQRYLQEKFAALEKAGKKAKVW